MKKLILLTTIILFINVISFSQSIIWQKSYGGSKQDIWPYMLQDAEGDLVTAISSQSDDYYIHKNYGLYDILCIKTNNLGDTIFSKNFGSYANDNPIAVIQAVDSGYLVAAETNDTTKINGGYNIWLIKINTNGDTVWTKTFGGSSEDLVYHIISTPDNNYILSVNSTSSDGDFANNVGKYDAWMVKISPTGNIIWKKHYGGSLDDKIISVTNTSDNGYIVCFASKSYDLDFDTNFGDLDIFIKKLNSSGETQWTKHIGGSKYDAISEILEYHNNYYLFGSTLSNDKEISGNHGKWDILAIKIDNTGNTIWQKCYGGSLNDEYRDAIIYNDNFVIAGATKSVDIGTQRKGGDKDAYILNIDTLGAIRWQKCYGGTKEETANQIIKSLDNNLIFCGSSLSNDGDLTRNFGVNDLWIVEISPNSSAITNNNIINNIIVYPNPITDHLIIRAEDYNIAKLQYLLFDINGKLLQSIKATGQETRIATNNILPANYLIKVIEGKKEVKVIKIIKK